jgi:hypothetical protein
MRIEMIHFLPRLLADKSQRMRFAAFVVSVAVTNLCAAPACLLPSIHAQDALDASSELPEATDNADQRTEVTLDTLATETPASWEYFAPIPLPSVETITPGQNSPLIEFKLGPDVFSHSRLDLSDMRIFDGTGTPHPYKLRILAPRSVRDVMPATEFNRVEPEDGEHEVTLEISADEGDHNEVQIVTSGEQFRRAVVIDGSNDGQAWARLANGHLLRFEDADQKIDVTSFTYSPSRYRFVRVRVQPDPESEMNDEGLDKFAFTDVRVLRTNELPGERSEWDVVVGDREPTRVMGTAGSAWIIDLQGDSVPCDRLEIEVENSEFNRSIEIQAEQQSDILGQPVFMPLYIEDEGNWQRIAGEQKTPMVIRFSEVYASRLRLLVADARNVPLTIRSAKASALARQVVMQRPPNPDESLKLFFGNPLAEPPEYDFARNLPESLDPKPASTSLEAVTPNPDFVPPPLPFTERLPWLVYAVLGLVSVVLLVIIASLARTSIAMHDAAAQDPTPLEAVNG